MLGPFQWRERYAAGIPSIFGLDYRYCTPAYRAWSAMDEDARLKTPWPQYRDSQAARPARRVSVEPRK